MSSLKKTEITPELEDLIYSNDAALMFVCSIIIFATNVFWIVVDNHNTGLTGDFFNSGFIVISLLIVFSVIIAVCLDPGKGYRIYL